MNKLSSLLLSLALVIGLTGLGFALRDGILRFRTLERSVTVKGLSEQEFDADVVIWPIRYSAADNELNTLYNTLLTNEQSVREYLLERGVEDYEISVSAPSIVDKLAQSWGSADQPEYRYSGTQNVTVYSARVTAIRSAMGELAQLGRNGIVLSGDDYQTPVDYLFTRLNDVKPDMIEEATREARQVAGKFAADSDSKLGKIKTASQGQFSIEPRDSNNPHIKRVRVVSTVEYYLID